MKKFNKIISTFLAVLMVLGCFASFAVVGVSADEAKQEISENDPSIYITKVFNTPEDKFESMSMSYRESGYEMRVDPITGEVAVKELLTGNILFTNPYDVGNSKAEDKSESTKHLLSQVMIKYTTNSGDSKKLYSFSDAAALGQIKTSRIQSGIRIEYSIGEEATRKLVPYRITDARYQEYILGPVTEAYENGLITLDEYQYFTLGEGTDGIYFTMQSLSKIKPVDHEAYIESMPILATSDVWQISPSLEKAILDQIEAVIKKCCPDYSFDMMDEDHAETGYRAIESAYPLFKLALEYSLDQDGLSVRMPCNGLRYDVNNFTLESVQILPYIGAGHNANEGYNFYPDGAGAIFDFQQVKGSGANYTQPVYGIDYAYHTIHEIKNQTPVRYPVYGVVSNEKIYSYSYSYVDKDTEKTVKVEDIASNTVIEAIRAKATELGATDFVVSEQPVDEYSRGYVAIIEEGESLALLSSYHAGVESEYNTILAEFNPRPSDEYDLSDSVSVSGETMFTVVSNRKYTGAAKIRYKMLTDESREAAALSQNNKYCAYETSWMGMAEYYRDYLIANGTLKKLTSKDVQADIPLYLEVFGAMETQQTIMTLPVQVMTPLTTFENIATMYDELSEYGVNNINFKLTGFANGGIYSTVPSDLDWEDAVGGKDGFKELVDIANEINEAKDNRYLGIYPDFDFAYISENKLFDNTNLNDDAVKTIDNRYTPKRLYSATQQKYVSFYQLAVSPSRYDKFYSELMENYGEYDLSTISVGSLGNALNSDFDEDDPYNREDSKHHTMQALEAIKESNDKDYSIMVDSANAYTWAYADHILNMDLDSSHHNKASAAVPFLGTVLHSYVQYAGTPLNEESNIEYAILKALESGAGFNFLLSYQNTTYLKEDLFLSQNYSVRYDIWSEDVIAYYNELNGLLKDVQTKDIIGHEFIHDEAERVLELAELEKQLESELKDALDELNQNTEQERLDQIVCLSDVRVLVYNILANQGDIQTANVAYNAMKSALNSLNTNYDLLKSAIKKFDIDAILEKAVANETDAEKAEAAAVKEVKKQLEQINKYAEIVMTESANYLIQEAKATKAFNALPSDNDLDDALTVVEETNLLADEIKQMYRAEIAEARKHLNNFKDQFGTDMLEQREKYIDYNAYFSAGSESSVVKLLADFYAGEAVIVPDGYEYAEAVEKAIKEVKADEAKLWSLGEVEIAEDEVVVDNSATNAEQSTDSNVTAYTVDKNSVVAVTYGDRVKAAGQGYKTTAYKTFILNYNSYAIRLVFDGVLYTIPANGYAAVYN